MARTYKINVLAEDFDLGEKKNSNRCAVKRAVARDIPGAKRVEVDLQTVRFSLEDERYVFLTPWRVADYVIAYDAGDDDELQPFSFQLRPSSEVGAKVERRAFTSEGQKVDNARNRVRKADARKERALEVVANPESSAVEMAKAQELLAGIDEEIAERKAEYEEIPQGSQEDTQAAHEAGWHGFTKAAS